MPRIRPLTKEQQWATTVTKTFKTALIAKGWTVNHLAELLGKDQGYISKVINHPLNIDLVVILSIADKLDVKLLPN